MIAPTRHRWTCLRVLLSAFCISCGAVGIVAQEAPAQEETQPPETPVGETPAGQPPEAPPPVVPPSPAPRDPAPPSRGTEPSARPSARPSATVESRSRAAGPGGPRAISSDLDWIFARRHLWPAKDFEISLSIDDAVQIGLKKNLNIRVARVDHGVTFHDLEVERSVFDPFFALGAEYMKNRRPTVSFLDIGQGAAVPIVQVNPTEFTNYFVGLRGRSPIGTTYDVRLANDSFDRPRASAIFSVNPQVSASASVQITQPLLKGAWYPYNTANIRIARNNRRISVRQLEQIAIDTVFQIEQAYWQVAYAIKFYEAQHSALLVAQEDLENARKQLAVGRLAPIDVTIVQSQVALRKASFNEAELLLENSRDTLLDLLNYSGQRSLRERWTSGNQSSPYDRILIIPISRPESESFLPERQQSLSTAFERRPDYLQIGLELRNQQERVDMARQDVLPQLDLTGSYEQDGLADDYDESISSLTDGKFYSWGVGIRLEVPIPLRGPKNALYRSEDILRRIHLQRTQKENQIVLEVDQTLRKLDSIYRRVQDLEERVRLQEQILDAERKKLRAGTSISYQVNTIENDLIDSQAQALRAKADYQTARAEYYRTVGTILDNYGIELLDDP